MNDQPLNEIFDPADSAHQVMMRDLDMFTASPGMNLHADTIKFLKTTQHYPDMILYRVLFLDSRDGLTEGGSFNHSLKRVSSWSKSLRIVDEMAVENDDLGNYAVILKAKVPGNHIVLDTTELSSTDLEYIKLFDQQEVIVDSIPVKATVLKIYDLD